MTPEQTDLPYAEIVKISGMDNAKYLKIDVKRYAGDICPQCQIGRIDYDGMLNLSCPECDYSLGGCFT